MLSSLREKLKKVKDFRRSQGTRHPLDLVLLIIIIGIMLGHFSYKGLDNFVKNNSKSLLNKLNILPERLPSYATIRRVIMGLDWESLLQIFQEWANEIYPYSDQVDELAIDGKSLRSTLKNSQDSEQNFVMIVSLFSQRTGLVLDLKRIENKETSEITAAQDIVRSCSQENKVFTLDALHCNQQLTKSIIAGNNDYLIPVKKNNRKLYDQIETMTKIETALSLDTSYDKLSSI